MRHEPAYTQLLNLISARSQQWLRGRLEKLAAVDDPDDRDICNLSQIAVAANICSGLRGSPAPLKVAFERQYKPELIDCFLVDYQRNSLREGLAGLAGRKTAVPAIDDLDWPAGGLSEDHALFQLVEKVLRQPVPRAQINDAVIVRYGRLLALSYRHGAARPRFASTKTYGEAFANCQRFADWAHRKGHLAPLALMCFCLCLIDPDYDVAPLLADLISSQRPDGSFPLRMGFGTADQADEALEPTIAATIALQMAVHRRWHTPRPIPLAA